MPPVSCWIPHAQVNKHPPDFLVGGESQRGVGVTHVFRQVFAIVSGEKQKKRKKVSFMETPTEIAFVPHLPHTLQNRKRTDSRGGQALGLCPLRRLLSQVPPPQIPTWSQHPVGVRGVVANEQVAKQSMSTPPTPCVNASKEGRVDLVVDNALVPVKKKRKRALVLFLGTQEVVRILWNLNYQVEVIEGKIQKNLIFLVILCFWILNWNLYRVSLIWFWPEYPTNIIDKPVFQKQENWKISMVFFIEFWILSNM